jgi:predicted nucleic acid-binding protein
MISVFVDSDIIIDLLAKRQEYRAAVKLLKLIRGKKIRAYTTPVVLANVDYIIKKFANKNKSRKALRSLRKRIQILPIDQVIVDTALESAFTDFEDALQYYAAEKQGMDFIVTRNKEDYKKGRIKIVTAQEFVDMSALGENETEV